MRLKLLSFLLLFVGAWGFGQTPFTTTYDLVGGGNDVISFSYNGITYDGIDLQDLLKVGITSSSSNNNYRGNNWTDGATNSSNTFTGSIDLGKYIQFQINAVPGYRFTVTSIQFGVGRSGTGTRQAQWRGDHDGFSNVINNYTTLNAGLTNTAGVLTNPDTNSNWTGNVLNVETLYTDVNGAEFRLYFYNAESNTGTAGLAGNLTINGTFEPIAVGPTITLTPASLTGLDYIVDNGPSIGQSFSVTASNLVPASGNLTVNAPANFQVSANLAGPYTNFINIPYTGGSLTATNVFVRLNDGLAINAYGPSNVAVSGGSATAQNVAVEGNVSILCGLETFNNFEGSNTNYLSGSFLGDNDVTWTYEFARTEFDGTNDFSIDGKGLMIRGSSDSYLEVEIAGGVGNFSFDYRKAFENAAARQLELIVNGTQVVTTPVFGNTSGFDSTVYNLSHAVNEPGNVIIRIKDVGTNATARQTVIDNIIWTCVCTSEIAGPTGTISGITPACSDTSLIYSSPSATTYWQTSAAGTSLQYPTTSDFEVTETGTYYVRAFDGFCWSIDTVNFDAVVNPATEIISQPSNQLVSPGDNATFQVNALNASAFQWQESTDNGLTWTNIGANNSTLTLNNVPLSSHYNRYRVIALSANCDNITSNIATLFVVDGSDVCIDEDFTAFPSGWTNNGSGTSTLAIHYGIASPSRSLGLGNSIITSSVDYPKFLQFYQDASNAGNGNIATIDYSIEGGAWISLYGFEVTTNGKTEVVDLSNINGVNLSSEFDVRFRFNSSFNTWYLDDVKVFCNPCTPASVASTANITSGPVGTLVTITGAGYTPLTTLSLNNTNISLISQTATQLVFEIPIGATTGNLLVFTPLICLETIPFEVIIKEIDCQTNFIADDLIFYEIYDEVAPSFGNGGMVTLFNATLSPINLSNYRIYRAATFGSTDFLVWFSPSGLLNPGEIYRIKVRNSTCTNYAEPSHEVIINYNANDGFELRKFDNNINSYVTIDQVVTPDYIGYYFQRDLSRPMPSITYDVSDWSLTQFMNTCTSGTIGSAPTFIGGLPEITSVSTDANTCNEASITVNAIEGYNETSPPADARQLNFQWFYFDGISGDWTEIITGGDFNIINTIDNDAGTGFSTLEIANTTAKQNYQYYCKVREDDNTCFVATNAIRIVTAQTIWNGTTWNPAPPDANTVAVLNANYTTAGVTPSFTACNLIVNAELNISDNYFIEVINDAVVNSGGNIIVQTRGAFVQRNDAGTFVLNGGNSSVNKDTAPKQNWYDYTYWSSPVVNETAENAFGLSPANRRFYFEAQNFVDTDGNDIDDIGNDWQIATGLLTPGLGYAVTSFNVGPFPRIDQNNFNGAFNNGIINVPVYRNPANPIASNNWNFIGNPYPSAIDFEEFHNQNAGAIEGSAYLWSQSLPPLAINPGNQVLNFNRNDYAIINVGSGNVAGGAVGLPPNNFIPSGQGFFVNATGNGTVTFSNSIRLADGSSNNNFYRSNNVVVPDKLWLNLTSDNGVFNQILVAYVPGATNNDDGMYYDAPRNLATGSYASLYSIIAQSDKPFAIQGKNPMGLNTDEVIALGFSTSIEVATLYSISIAQLQGDFMTSETVYLKDNLLNSLHNLSESDYTFTSEVGDFKERFEVVFNRESLSVGEALLSPQSLSIIELSNGDVQFSVAENHQIKTIEIIDLQGRTIYRLKGASNLETYNLSQLSSAAYVAKVTLSNGQTINKKAIKRL